MVSERNVACRLENPRFGLEVLGLPYMLFSSFLKVIKVFPLSANYFHLVNFLSYSFDIIILFSSTYRCLS